MITNPRRRKQVKEFFGKDRPVMEEYYAALEAGLSYKKMRSQMERLIQKDALFFDPYIVIADILASEGKSAESKKLLKEVYEVAVRQIADKDGNWPKSMPWGWLENRHIMRTIDRYAYQLWRDGHRAEALDIFRKLLRANPGDNQGVRYSILAIRLGLGTGWEENFLAKDGPLAGQVMEASPLLEWFDKNAKKFPEEFGWLLKLYKEEYEN